MSAYYWIVCEERFNSGVKLYKEKQRSGGESTSEDTGERGDSGVMAGEGGDVSPSFVSRKRLFHSLVQ